MNKLLIASFDMEIGGVERSLISMLNHFDYERNQVDLMLYRHRGELLPLLPPQTNVLPEITAYRTFRMSIGETLMSRQFSLGMMRMIAKWQASLHRSSENGYKQMQYMWKYSLPFLPTLKEEYDVAISYLWPHYFVAEKVEAKRKIAWIHTDYSTVDTNEKLDVAMWDKFDYLVAVSNDCRRAFVKKYPSLIDKVHVMENITAPNFVRTFATEKVAHPCMEDRRFKIVTVARLSHAKGIDLAIKAMKILKDRGYRHIAWYVVGYGGEEAFLKESIAKHDLTEDFFLLGKKTNPYPYMQMADLYVQPSRYEGKAVTVIEAQILGKPVLITNYPTANSQIKHGYDGLICKRSPIGIANGIEHLYNDAALRTKLARNCQQTNYRNEEELDKLYQLL